MKFTFAPESKPLDGYTIKRAIHKGGFGEVYYALSDHGKEVALKLLHENTDVELRGVTQCLNLKHPNLVSIFDIRKDDDGDYWVIMEYVSGKSLDLAMATYPEGMPLDEVRHWLTGIAAGLTYLHDKGIVHRDLKPANIFSEGDAVKVGDVGLAKFISDSRRNAQTESVGTVYYMAPEVARGHYGHEVDVYSIGVMLYEMITGRVPFDGESTAEILMKHLSERPDLSVIPPPLRPVLAGALEKDPLKRTPSVAQLLADFERGARAAAATIGPTIYPPNNPAPRETPVNLFAEAPTPPPIPARVPPPLHPYAEKYARKYEKKAAKWAEREQKKAEKYARKYGGAAYATAQYVAQPVGGNLASNPHRRTWGDQLHFWVRLAAVGIVLIAIFFPAMLRGVFPALMIAGGASVIILGVWKLFSLLSAPVPSPRAPYVGGPEVAASPVFDSEQLVARPIAAPARQAVPVPVAVRAPAYSNDEYQGRQLDPSTPRVLSMRRRMTELSGSMTFAVLATAALTGALATLTPLLPDAGLAAAFATLVLLASWTVMGATKILEGRGHDAVGRRILFAGLGLGLGALAFWLNGALLADLPNSNLVNPPIFTSVGQHALSDASAQPTLIGYLVFFGGIFATRRWWWHADSFRKRRFRVMSVLLTAGMAFLLSWVWQFPQVWGVAFATTVATVVHLSSVWTPPAQRPKLVA